MAEERQKEIERSAEEIVESFVKATEGLPGEREMYYSQDACNVVRPDGEPSSSEERVEFRKRFIKIMPGKDEDGNLRVEVAKWVR